MMMHPIKLIVNKISREKISYKIKAPTFVDALFVAPPPGPISNHLLKDIHELHLLYQDIQASIKSPSLN